MPYRIVVILKDIQTAADVQVNVNEVSSNDLEDTHVIEVIPGNSRGEQLCTVRFLSEDEERICKDLVLNWSFGGKGWIDPPSVTLGSGTTRKEFVASLPGEEVEEERVGVESVTGQGVDVLDWECKHLTDDLFELSVEMTAGDADASHDRRLEIETESGQRLAVTAKRPE